MFRADLHCHTIFSDGTMTPEKLLHLAQEVGLSGISITDHDTIEAYSEAPAIAKQLGILLGSGIEFSCVFQKMSVHVLGYDFDLNSSAIAQLCARHQQRRALRNKAILDNLSRLGMKISEEELLAIGEKTLGRPHIAKLMVEKGYVSSIKEAFNHYIGDGQPCYTPGEGVSVQETIEIIHRGYGKAFIAHPHLLNHSRKIKELLKFPFNGIECHYAKFPLEQENRWIQVAKEKGWLISGGSDFHGSSKDYIQLGCSWVDEDNFHKIFQHLV
jgi:3',5'-nucleoside bisphosphate phosphatase